MLERQKSKLEKLIKEQERVRSICVIAHVDHGKTTLTDCLIRKAGISNKERYIDSVRKDQINRIITIKSTGITLSFNVGNQLQPTEYPKEQRVINIVDSPGHVDFSAEVTSAIRLTDGALLVVDCVSGVAVQTETVLRQAIEERIVPVLMLNKLDRALLELKKSPEQLYNDLKHTIDRANNLIQLYTPEGNKPVVLDPLCANVAFGSGKQGWAFTLLQFASIYANKKGTSVEKMKKYLWGDWFYNNKTKKWKKLSTNSLNSNIDPNLERGFCKFVLKPLYKMCKLCYDPSIRNKWNKFESMSKAFCVNYNKEKQKKVTEAFKQEEAKYIMKSIFQAILPAADPILSMICTHVPSPKEAQKYRVEHLYTGPIDDCVGKSIKECNESGPMVLYISKMVPFNKSFLAYGRVLSGTIRELQKVTILGPDYNPTDENKKDIWKNVTIKSLKLSLAKEFVSISEAKCGNIVCIGGIDKYINKCATLISINDEHKNNKNNSNCENETVLYPIKSMSFSVTPVVRVAISAKKASDLPKLKEGLTQLSKSGPLVKISFDESSKQYIIEGSGELHIEILIKDLKNFCGIELKVSKPVVPLRETVTSVSSQICLAKSSNKLNRIYVTAEPLDQKLVENIESGKLDKLIKCGASKALTRYLVENHNWDSNDAKRIWCFGPTTSERATNVLVDQTRSADYLNEIKDHLISSFEKVVSSGILGDEPLTGVRFNIKEVKVHSDSSHRGASQIIPAACRAFKAAQLSASPRFVEPIFMATINVSRKQLGNVYNYISSKRTQFVSEKHIGTASQVQLKAYLPVFESFGFDCGLKACSSGEAFPSLQFSHWTVIDCDPLVQGTSSHQLLLSTRKRKGNNQQLPQFEMLVDKL